MVIILLTQPATSRKAWYGLWLAESMLTLKLPFQVFFYQNAASIANELTFHPSDTPCLRQAWVGLNIDLPVCVSAALQRGITDADNAKRHSLTTQNMASGFRLAGLGELAEQMLTASRIVQL